MNLLKINPKKTQAWKALEKHYLQMQYVKMQELFDNNPQRAEQMHIQWEDFLLDFSKNKLDATTLKLLYNLADEMQLKKGCDAMKNGNLINETEHRAVGHVWLRDLDNHWQSEYHEEIEKTLKKIADFSDEVLSGKRKGSTNKSFTDVVNIGIGGSDLGPKLVVESLEDYQTHLNIHYISNIDYDSIQHTLDKLNPETTLVIVVSKSFTTKETLSNANLVKSWFEKHNLLPNNHFVAVTAAEKEAINFGIPSSYIFPMWDWVGGRFSLWSAVGLSISLGVGFKNFEDLLRGAHELDQHFFLNEFEQNIPVTLALISIWYANFFAYETEAVIPYANRLKSLPSYLQQVVMESNGKNVSRLGEPVEYQTCNIIWGEIGTNSQHAFFQLFHQGTKIIPSDFIGFIKPFKDSEMHLQFMANFFAQTEGLMNGKEGKLYNKNQTNTDQLAPYKFFKGNRPTNTLLINQLTPKTLGALLAIYEHKTFVQGYLWNIFSFDQFGVEYGKVLANTIAEELQQKQVKTHDASTTFLLNHFLEKSK